MFKKLRKNEKGFTLAELLIVVAIIGVLVAISIPIFTSQLEKAREATDAANLRSAYAEIAACAITGDNLNTKKDSVTINDDGKGNITTITAKVGCAQKQTGWDDKNITDIGGVAIADIPATTLKGWTITYTASTGDFKFTENS